MAFKDGPEKEQTQIFETAQRYSRLDMGRYSRSGDGWAAIRNARFRPGRISHLFKGPAKYPRP